MVNFLSRSWISGACASALLLAAGSTLAAVPTAPPSICIDGVCTSSPAVAAAPSGKSIKWHPGTYVWYAPSAVGGVPGHRVDLATQRAQFLTFVNSICSESSISGVQLFGLWRTFEGDTAGDYSAGFAAVDALLAKLTACNKRLMVGFQTVWFGTHRTDLDIFPAYIVNDSRYGVTGLNPGTGRTARTWQAPTMDRLIAMSQAYGARYNSHPNFEMIGLGETSLQVTTDGFSSEANLAQTKRMIVAARQHWPNTAVRIMVNDGFSDAGFIDLYNTCKTYYCALGGPDVWPGDITQADRLFVGKNTSGQDVHEDLRDKLPWAVDVDWQSFNLVDGHPRWTLRQLYDAPMIGYTPTNPNGQGSFRMPSMKVKYMIWLVNESNGNQENQWSTAQLPFLRSVNGAVYSNTCPTSYPSCNSN